MKCSEENIKIKTIEDWYQYAEHDDKIFKEKGSSEDRLQFYIKVASKGKHLDKSLEGKSPKDQNLLSHYLDNIFLYSDKRRYLEAIDYCQKCEDIANDFLLPMAIKALLLIWIFNYNFFIDDFGIWNYLYTDQRERAEMELYRLLLVSLKKIKINQYKRDHIFQKIGEAEILDIIKLIETFVFYEFFNINKFLFYKESFDINKSFFYDEKNNNEYYNWCKKKKLLLNRRNVISSADVYNDNLKPRTIIRTRADIPGHSMLLFDNWMLIYDSWQQSCQEYTSSRYIFYKYDSKIDDKPRTHFSDERNFIIDKYYYDNNNIIYSLEIEELKSAYVKLYNIFDKIAVLVFSYIKSFNHLDINKYIKNIQTELKILEKKGIQISFNTFSKISKRKELIELIKKNNLFLYCLFNINEDINSHKTFTLLKTIRNKITHGYIQVVSCHDDKNYQRYNENEIIYQNYLQIEINHLKSNFEFLLYTIKNSLFYCKFCMDKIEKDFKKD